MNTQAKQLAEIISDAKKKSKSEAVFRSPSHCPVASKESDMFNTEVGQESVKTPNGDDTEVITNHIGRTTIMMVAGGLLIVVAVAIGFIA